MSVTQLYFGPSPYSQAPVFVTTVEGTEQTGAIIELIWAQLQQAYPDWLSDCPSPEQADHPTHALALMMAYWSRGLLNSVQGFIEAAGAVAVSEHSTHLWLGFHVPAVTSQAVALAFSAVEETVAEDVFPSNALAHRIKQLQELCKREHPDSSSAVLMRGAAACNVPVIPIDAPAHLYQYGWGSRSQIFFEASANHDGTVGRLFARDKRQFAKLLRRLGFPAPVHFAVSNPEDAVRAAGSVHYPCVLKPIESSQGRGVTVNITTPQAVSKAFALAQQVLRAPVLVESFIKGNDFRLLVVNGELAAAVRREQSAVSNVLDSVHADIKTMSEAVALNAGLAVAEINYVTTDITHSWLSIPGAVIKINANPRLGAYLAGGVNAAELGGKILGVHVRRIPVVVLIAPAEEQARLIEAVLPGLGRYGLALGLLSQDLLSVAGISFPQVLKPLPERVEQILLNKNTEAALIAVSIEDIMRFGFPVDHCALTIMRGESYLATLKAIIQRSSEQAINAGCEPDWLTEELLGSIGRVLLAETESIPVASTALKKPQVTIKASQSFDLAGFKFLKRHQQTDGLSLFALVRNEAYLLPHFCEHYRQLGIENFWFYDDGSTDGTLDYLAAQNDCTVLASEFSFQQKMPNGMKFHHYAKNAVPQSLGVGCWVLNVDMDEFLVLPTGYSSVQELVQELEVRKHNCVLASMVDFYPGKLSERHYAPRHSPFEVCTYFDKEKGFIRTGDDIRPGKVMGGVRARLIQMLQQHAPARYEAIFQNRGYMMASMWKVPLIKNGCGVVRTGSHSVNVQAPFDMELALAHFKFGPDLDGKISDALMTRNHALGSIEYEFLQAAVELFSDENLLFEGSVLFTGAESLEQAGQLFVNAFEAA